MGKRNTWGVAGLFSGVGGLERGLEKAGSADLGFETKLLCERDPYAANVLEHRFGLEPEPDVQVLDDLPRSISLLTAGFPCQDLSQVGTKRGILGPKSGLVRRVFDLLGTTRVPWVLLENVENLLRLDKGRAMDFLVEEFERLGYRWCYRVVDSRAFGLPHRRQRVFMLGSLERDPGPILLSGSVEPDWPEDTFDPSARAYGFYWTEGNRGVGWARESVPSLKVGSGWSIPSAPGIWLTDAAPDTPAIGTPSIEVAERLQGFPAGWTGGAGDESAAQRARWRLVGNAVSVPVATWIGRRLLAGESGLLRGTALTGIHPWPDAAYGGAGKRYAVDVTRWPKKSRPRDLADMLGGDLQPLSLRATKGFYDRLRASSLRVRKVQPFMSALRRHIRLMERESLARA